ncbi:MAG: hypothetical protein ACI36Z_10015 [Alloprevotella sp.]
MKSIRLMSDTEKLEYLARVEKWTDETYPMLAALTDSWTEAEWKDYDEGIELVTALQQAKDFVSNAYLYEIKRSIQKINLLLTDVRKKTELSRIKSRPANDKHHYVAHVPATVKTDENGVPVAAKEPVKTDVSGRRPEHLSQYIDLIGEDLKKESMQLPGWYDQLSHWRGRAEYLADDPRATRDMLKNVAATVVKIEQRILNFWERVDMAYSKATGKKVDDSVVNALKKEADALSKEETKQDGEYTKQEIDAMEDGEMKERCRRARIEANKKFVRRSDIKMNEERKAQISLRMQELVDWGQRLTKKAINFANENGIELPEEYRVPQADTLFD